MAATMATLQVLPGPNVLILGLSAILAVAAIGVSLFAVWRTQALVVLAGKEAHSDLEQCRSTVSALQKAVDQFAAELRDLQQQAPAAPPGLPGAGLNLSKRSQVLRMHRQGEQPRKISAALQVPQQEVDLLIKVHRIVLGKL